MGPRRVLIGRRAGPWGRARAQRAVGCERWRRRAGSGRCGSRSARWGWRSLCTRCTWRPRGSGTPATGPRATSAPPSAAPRSSPPDGAVALAWWRISWGNTASLISRTAYLASSSTPYRHCWASLPAPWRPSPCWAPPWSPSPARSTWPTSSSSCSTTSALCASPPTCSTAPSSSSTTSVWPSCVGAGRAAPSPRGSERGWGSPSHPAPSWDFSFG